MENVIKLYDNCQCFHFSENFCEEVSNSRQFELFHVFSRFTKVLSLCIFNNNSYIQFLLESSRSALFLGIKLNKVNNCYSLYKIFNTIVVLGSFNT